MDPITAIIIGVIIALVLYWLFSLIDKVFGFSDDGTPWPHGMMSDDEDEHRWI